MGILSGLFKPNVKSMENKKDIEVNKWQICK